MCNIDTGRCDQVKLCNIDKGRCDLVDLKDV